MPVIPKELAEKKDKESTFVSNFHLVASRDNKTRHKLEREYFDRPFLTARDGTFAPVISRTRLLAAVKSPRALEIPLNEDMSQTSRREIRSIKALTTASQNTLSPGRPSHHQKKKGEIPLLTTGLSELEFEAVKLQMHPEKTDRHYTIESNESFSQERMAKPILVQRYDRAFQVRKKSTAHLTQSRGLLQPRRQVRRRLTHKTFLPDDLAC